MLETLVRVIRSGKQALDAVRREMGRRVAERVMLMEREEVAGPDYYPTDPVFKQGAHEAGSLYLGDQKVKVTRPRLRHVEQGEMTLQSSARLRTPEAFSEELLEKGLRGVSAQKYAETVQEYGLRLPEHREFQDDDLLPLQRTRPVPMLNPEAR